MKDLFTAKSLKKIFYILLGTFIMSLGAYFFNIPSKIASGGTIGLAQALNYFIPSINMGVMMLILNVLLLVIGLAVLGNDFGVYTVIGALSYTAYIAIWEKFVPMDGPILTDKIANLVLGAGLIGFGISIVFRQNASTGGTDVLAKIIEKFTDFNLSTCMIIVDATVIFMATLAFGLQNGIYSMMSLLTASYTVDKSIAGFNSKIQLTISSKHLDEINNYIMKEMNRGTTLYKAAGGFTKNDKFILVTIVNKKQYVKIRNFIKHIDEDAFVYIASINEVIGYGFSRELRNVSIGENAETSN